MKMEMIELHRVTVLQLARYLYALMFPLKKFEDLPEYVQDAWKRDAYRLKEMVANGNAIDAGPSGG